MPSFPCHAVSTWTGGLISACAGKEMYLLGLQRVVRCLDGHVLVSADLDAVCDDALGVALVGEGIGDGFALAVGDLVRY